MITLNQCNILNYNLSKHSEFEHMKEFNDKVYNTRTPKGDVRT